MSIDDKGVFWQTVKTFIDCTWTLNQTVPSDSKGVWLGCDGYLINSLSHFYVSMGMFLSQSRILKLLNWSPNLTNLYCYIRLIKHRTFYIFFNKFKEFFLQWQIVHKRWSCIFTCSCIPYIERRGLNRTTLSISISALLTTTQNQNNLYILRHEWKLYLQSSFWSNSVVNYPV